MSDGLERVLLVDDDDGDASIVQGPLARSGVEVIRATDALESVDGLVELIRSSAVDATLCDNRLAIGGLADFTGAEAMARCFDEGLPGVLITTYVDSDAGVSIRRWRRQIPSLLKRTDAKDPERVARAVADCRSELAGNIAYARQGRRTVFRVRDVMAIGGDRCVDVVLVAWNPAEGVRLPVSLLPDAAVDRPDAELIGTAFSAFVNTSAIDEHDLFFERVEEIPPGTETDLIEASAV